MAVGSRGPAIGRGVARRVVAALGLLLVTAGAFAIVSGFQPGSMGADVALALGGTGIVFLGVLMAFGIRPDLVRTGLAAATAGYFAVQLAAFEAGTRRCDINPQLSDCG